MARIHGVDLPKNKRVIIALTYIFGIGPKKSEDVLGAAKVNIDTKVKDLTEDEIIKIRSAIADLKIPVEGDLRRDVQSAIRRLGEIACYRGIRHKKGLPVRGQRTHTNARTKRGKRIAVAGKKKVTK